MPRASARLDTSLDNPVWHSLSGRNARFAIADNGARRFAPDIAPFAGTADRSPGSVAALGRLVAAHGLVALMQAEAADVPDGTRIESQAAGVQMVAGTRTGGQMDLSPLALGNADTADMLALATLTEPGPFRARTHLLGNFIGVRIDGRLAAMAGERLKLDGYTEVSGVCTHPDFRGRGLAGALSRIVAERIVARGETPMLHAWTTNARAIALYEALGFRIRREVTVTLLAPDA